MRRLASDLCVAAMGLVALAALSSRPASAAPPQASYTSPAGWYFWVDGMYDHVKLAPFALGWHNVTAAPATTDAGVAQTFKPDMDGGGIRGALGYIIPGTQVRFEFGGSYISARQTASQFSTNTTGTVTTQLLDGSHLFGAFGCNTGESCAFAGALTTHYDAWQLNGKIARDFQFGMVTIIPSLALFGGNTSVHQTLNQNFTQFLGAAVENTGTYFSDTRERWRDIGGRFGLDANVPVTPAFAFGIGGWIGGANRHTSLTGADNHADSAGTTPLASLLSTSANKGVLLANGETRLTYQWMQNLALRGFFGVNYDNSVPGIAGPSFTGSINPPTSTSPAHISYAAETSYYAGGGVVVTW
jgi:hypothetical protein